MRCDLNSVPLVWKLVVVIVLAILALEPLLRDRSDEEHTREPKDGRQMIHQIGPSPNHQELQATWEGAIEGWKDLPASDAASSVHVGYDDVGYDDVEKPGLKWSQAASPTTLRTYYLCPEPLLGSQASDLKRLPGLPEAVTKDRVVFALTSWNPGGKELPPEENNARYTELGSELRAEAGALQMWKSFGFDLGGYRENGYTLAFSSGDAAIARARILAVAMRHGQGAIYEFWPVPGDPSRLTRFTVPAAMDRQVAGEAKMAVCSPPDSRFADPDMLFPTGTA